jgi:hypothetical protein
VIQTKPEVGLAFEQRLYFSKDGGSLRMYDHASAERLVRSPEQ